MDTLHFFLFPKVKRARWNKDSFQLAVDKHSVGFRFWRTETHRNGGHWVEVEFVEADSDSWCAFSLLRQLFDKLQLWTQFTASVFPKVTRARWEKDRF